MYAQIIKHKKQWVLLYGLSFTKLKTIFHVSNGISKRFTGRCMNKAKHGKLSQVFTTPPPGQTGGKHC